MNDFGVLKPFEVNLLDSQGVNLKKKVGKR